MEKLNQIRAQMSAVWSEFSAVQRATFGAVLLIALGGFWWVVVQATKPDWRVLYGELEPQSASKIAEELTKRKIPFKLVDSATIAVPREQLHEARLHIAGTGVTDATAAGYELFDESDFGMTAFTQKVNYKRAMENELARTIKHIRMVQDARVHLVMPAESLFAQNQKLATASVVLKLSGGASLPPGQIQAIQHLVASAVEGMSPDKVTLVDQDGRLLARPQDELAFGGEGALESARKIEAALEGRIIELLSPLVGANGLRAKVHVDLDTRTVVETSELFDPEMTAVRSEQRSEQSNANGGVMGMGAPGIGANLNQAERGGRDSASSKVEEVTNYEVSKRVVQTTQNGAGISRLTVAVLVNQSVSQVGDVEGEVASPVVDLAQIQMLVKSAVGFEDARGDVLEVSLAQFVAPQEVAEAPAGMAWMESDVLVPVARYATIGFLALLLFVFVIRPMTQVFKPGPALIAETSSRQVEAEIIGRRVGDVGDESIRMEGAPKLAQLRDEVIGLSSTDLEKTAMILSHWIRTDTKA